MKKPRCKINTDDEMSMNSQMEITVCKPLNRVFIDHYRQTGRSERIQIYPEQIDPMIKFLSECKAWIDSGYKDEFRPERYNEFKGRKQIKS